MRQGLRVRFPGEPREVIWKVGGFLSVETDVDSTAITREIQLHLFRKDRHGFRSKRTRCLSINLDGVHDIDSQRGAPVFLYVDRQNERRGLSFRKRKSFSLRVV